MSDDSVRINKYIAEQGWASRREADALISQGKVLVNGKPATIGQRVSSSDAVKLKGEIPDHKYYAYYKGRGVITHSPTEGETDIATKLARDHQIKDVYPVGRLDKDSEGLILLTDDGRVTGALLDPAAGIEKEYEVIVDKPLKGNIIKQLERGVKIENYTTKPAKVVKQTPQKFNLILTEGKKHQIRRMCAALGYQVQRLKRVRVANIELGKLKPNQYRKLRGAELTTLLTTLGIK